MSTPAPICGPWDDTRVSLRFTRPIVHEGVRMAGGDEDG